MGACGSKVQAWREEAEEEWKEGKQLPAAEPAPPPQPELRLPHDAPASYVPPLPPPPPKAGQEAGGMHRDPSGLFAFRKSQELSMGACCSYGQLRLCLPVCLAAPVPNPPLAPFTALCHAPAAHLVRHPRCAVV